MCSRDFNHPITNFSTLRMLLEPSAMEPQISMPTLPSLDDNTLYPKATVSTNPSTCCQINFTFFLVQCH